MRINGTSSVLGNQGENSILWLSQHNGYTTSSKAMKRWEWQCSCLEMFQTAWSHVSVQKMKWCWKNKKQNDGISDAKEGGGSESRCSEHWALRRESSESGEKEQKVVRVKSWISLSLSPLFLSPICLFPSPFLHTHMVTDTMIAGSSQCSQEQLPLRSVLTTMRNNCISNNTIALLLKFCQKKKIKSFNSN